MASWCDGDIAELQAIARRAARWAMRNVYGPSTAQMEDAESAAMLSMLTLLDAKGEPVSEYKLFSRARMAAMVADVAWSTHVAETTVQKAGGRPDGVLSPVSMVSRFGEDPTPGRVGSSTRSCRRHTEEHLTVDTTGCEAVERVREFLAVELGAAVASEVLDAVVDLVGYVGFARAYKASSERMAAGMSVSPGGWHAAVVLLLGRFREARSGESGLRIPGLIERAAAGDESVWSDPWAIRLRLLIGRSDTSMRLDVRGAWVDPVRPLRPLQPRLPFGAVA